MIHNPEMATLDERLIQVDRATQLRFLAQLINQMTFRARSNYDASDGLAQLVEVNEAIHRMTGHLRDLLEVGEPMTESRSAAIAACANVLVPSELARLRAWAGV